MDFGLSEEQQLIIKTTRDFVHQELVPHEREVETSGVLREQLWQPLKAKAIAAGLYAANMPSEVGGAGLDVYEHEPAVNPKLVRLAKQGKVTLLPHMGSATIEGRVEMGEKVIINIRTFLDNHKPPDRVLPSML